jgi:MoaA/NifB/PqqE/SkfB family radical SAM enzyme
MNPIEIINNNFKNSMTIEYLVGTTCNYKCHYCFTGCNDGKYKFTTDLALLKKNLGYMIDVYRNDFNKTDIRLNINGGEPTLWPDLGEFAKHFSEEYNCRVTIVTNGSRTLRFWKEYGNYFEDIAISVHNQECDVEHIKKVMDYLYENTDCLVNATVFMDPLNFNRAVEIAEDLKNHSTPWLLKVRPIVLNGVMPLYTKEQKEYINDKVKKMPPPEWIEKIKKLGRMPQSESEGMMLKLDNGEIIKIDTQYLMERDWYHFEGWQCNMGVDRFVINRGGVIQGSCGAQNLFNLDKPLTIYDTDLTEKFNKDIVNPLICKQPYCGSPTEVKLPKQKIYDRTV